MGKTRLAVVVVTGLVLLAQMGRLGAGGGASVASEGVPQGFVSGSTGADGALDLATNCSSPYSGDPAPASCYVQLPPNGVLNYTTVNVPSGKTLKFIRNLVNSPAYVLAQGPINIAGTVSVAAGDFRPPSYSHDQSFGGVGGFDGGPVALPGFGPGAGQGYDGSGSPSEASHGRWVGPLTLVPLIGGSGGGGGAFAFNPRRGGGGGGALLLASSTLVSVQGHITAMGGHSGGFLGSGGAIRIVSQQVTISGSMNAHGGGNAATFGGVIRLEAPAGAVDFTGSASPAAVVSAVNPAIFSSTIPALTIVSVGGYPVPAYAGQRFDTVDLLLPMQLPDPINVVVAATNIPVGTQIHMSFGTGNTGTVTPGTLSGSSVSSQATVGVSGLNRTQLAYLFVHATFPVATGANVGNPPGPDQVARVQASAPPGGATRFAFLRQDGTRVPDAAVPPQLLKQFRQ